MLHDILGNCENSLSNIITWNRVMNDRVKTRPKTTTSAMARSTHLNYSVVRSSEGWRREAAGLPMWSADNGTVLGKWPHTYILTYLHTYTHKAKK